MAAAQPGPDDRPRLGSMFGRYRLDALIGRGGMGVVFRATDTTLDRPVALKFISPELAADPSFRTRFERESRLPAAIDHESIVTVYEAGAIGETLFIAMRFVPGRDLATILSVEAPLSYARTLAIARQIAGALDAAHLRGLVHRDVKPANILVTAGPAERAYLADFGMTRRLGDLTGPTRGGVVGTTDYVAPEQIQAGSVDGRADQYGLACVLVHCLTGAPPFSGESDAATLYAHLHRPPPRVDSRRADLPKGVGDALERALAKSPDDRFADCGSFVAALAGRPTTGPVGADGWIAAAAHALRRSGSGRRSRAVVAVAAGLAVVIAVGGLVAAPGDSPPFEPSGATTAPGATIASASDGRITGLRAGEVIVFASDVDGDYDIYALDPGSEDPRKLTDSPWTERQPAISRDGRSIAYVVGDIPRRDIWLMDADGHGERPLVRDPGDDTAPSWSADGSLAFASARGGADYDVFEIPGGEDELRERATRRVTTRPSMEQHPDWAPSGRTMVIASDTMNERDIFVIDADRPGSFLRRTSTRDFDFGPVFGPDRSIAFFRRRACASCPLERGLADLFVWSQRSRRERQLTTTRSREEIDPEWAPDGRAIVHAAGRLGAMELWIRTPTGGDARRLVRGMGDAIEPAWGIRPPDMPVASGTSMPP